MASTSELIGYDPATSAQPKQVTPSGAPATIDQWIADFAVSAATSMANGTLNAAEGTVFTDAFMKSAGLNIKFDPADFAAGREVSDNTFNQLVQLATYIANNWDTLTPEQQAAFPSPKGLQPASASPGLSEQDKANITQATINAANNASQAQIQAAADAAALERTRIQEEGATERTRLQIASSEGIADKDRAESARQFDLGLAEDRRQFNVDTIMGLFDRGIALAQNPVDWLGYQYWLENLAIPVNAITLSSAATLMGAIPPSGPSELGPVIGGPSAYDGDFTVAQQFGIQNAGPVPLDQAVTMNPGQGAEMGWTTSAGNDAMQTITNFGGMEQVGAAFAAAARDAAAKYASMPGIGDHIKLTAEAANAAYTKMGPGSIANAPQSVLDAYAAAKAQMGPGAGMQPPGPGTPGVGNGVVDFAGNPAYGAPPPLPPMAQPNPDPLNSPVSSPPAPPQPSTGGPYTGLEGVAGLNTTGQALPPIPGVTQPAANGAAASGGMTAPMPPGGMSPASADMSGAPPQQQQQGNQAAIDQALMMLAQELGLPVEQVRQMFPVELLGQTQAPGGIVNSPVIQSLKNQTPFGQFNTGPRDGAFTQLKGFGGVSTGIRGGQDVNAAHYLGALQPMKDMAQGVWKAQGLSVPGVLEQMMKAAPVSQTADMFKRR